MFEVVFLGTSGSVPTVERGMPAIAVKYGPELLLWDCGEGTQRQMMRHKVGYGSVNAIMITHPHLDHYLGMFGMLETIILSSVSPKPLKVVVPSGIGEGMLPRYRFADVSVIRKGVVYSAKDFEVRAFPVEHGRGAYGLVLQENDRRRFHEKKAHSLGLKGPMFREIQAKGSLTVNGRKVLLDDVSYVQPGRKLVYSGDTRPCPALLEAAKGADLLIHEGTFDESKAVEAKERLHSTVAEAAALAKEAGVNQLAITHISPRYSDVGPLEEQVKKVFRKAVFATDGMRIML